MAIHSNPIQPNSNTFYILNVFGDYIVYESFFGNVVKIYSQTAYGQINRISSLVKYMTVDRNTPKLKLFYMTTDPSSGLTQQSLPPLIKGRRGSKYQYKGTSATFTSSTKPVRYDIIVPEAKVFYCIETKKHHYLYDYDFGNPLMGNVELPNGSKYVVKSGKKDATMKLIETLPSDSIVYSLKVHETEGLVSGDPKLARDDGDNKRARFDKLTNDKKTDKTKLRSNLKELRLKYRDETFGVK